MGMFDSVNIVCPNCASEVEFQSKAGDCVLDVFNASTVPDIIAADLVGESQVCRHCGATVVLSSPCKLHAWCI